MNIEKKLKSICDDLFDIENGVHDSDFSKEETEEIRRTMIFIRTLAENIKYLMEGENKE
jgi:hypothetical protein